jgi:putative ABC transport system permease protein
MFKNYFKTALRNLSRNKFFATLNVFSLALGMSISLIFVALLSFLYRYDNFHPNRDKIYRITTHITDNESNPDYASAPVGIAEALHDNIPGIENIVRITRTLGGQVVYNNKEISLSGYFADEGFLTMFNFPLLHGDAKSALDKPNSIVITSTLAQKIFNSEDVVGEVISLEPYGDILITGVLADLPKNTHMSFEAIASFATLPIRAESWTKFLNSYVYIQLSDNATTNEIDKLLSKLGTEKYKSPKDKNTTFRLQSLNDIVPGPALNNAIGPSWDYISVAVFGLLTIIILVPACANYINLSISQSLRRMKEIGVRKVMGGQKKQIFLQFVMETCITMVLALGLAYLFFEVIRGEALEMIAEADILDLTPTILTFAGFIGFALLIGLIAGIVPALYFSKIAPVNALKGKEASPARGGLTIRKVVITAQFVLSLGFIMAVVIMMQQYRYSVNYDFGFDRKNILDVELQNADQQLFKNEFSKLSPVHAISMSSHVPGLGSDKGYIKNIGSQDSIEASSISIDENFIGNMKIELLFGRNFNNNAMENSRVIIVNEEFAKKLNKDDLLSAIDQSLILPNQGEVRIVGIVKNFHYASLRDPISSFYFTYNPDHFRYANVKMQSDNINKDVASMEAAWKIIGSDKAFIAQFLSNEISESYEFYFVLIKLWSFLGLMAITVACLGMLGTVVFTIKNRLKEISLRKVMGASPESLVFLLSKDFVFLMVISIIITTPVVYYLFENLLVSIQHYSVSIGPIEIIISVLIMLTLGLSTIISQTLRAANTNPVDNLKVE